MHAVIAWALLFWFRLGYTFISSYFEFRGGFVEQPNLTWVVQQSVAKIMAANMKQHNLKNVNNYLNTNIYSYLETYSGQSSNIFLNVVHFFNTSVN